MQNQTRIFHANLQSYLWRGRETPHLWGMAHLWPFPWSNVDRKELKSPGYFWCVQEWVVQSVCPKQGEISVRGTRSDPRNGSWGFLSFSLGSDADIYVSTEKAENFTMDRQRTVTLSDLTRSFSGYLELVSVVLCNWKVWGDQLVRYKTCCKREN